MAKPPKMPIRRIFPILTPGKGPAGTWDPPVPSATLYKTSGPLPGLRFSKTKKIGTFPPFGPRPPGVRRPRGGLGTHPRPSLTISYPPRGLWSFTGCQNLKNEPKGDFRGFGHAPFRSRSDARSARFGQNLSHPQGYLPTEFHPNRSRNDDDAPCLSVLSGPPGPLSPLRAR